MTKHIYIDTERKVAIPTDALATQTIGILAKRGAGKSTTAAVLVEEMFAAKIPFVVLDPMDVWWGLQTGWDGKSKGLPVPVFGGERGNIPLEKGGGAELADVIADQRLSCVISTSAFSETDKIRFVTDFAERLYRKNRDPLQVLLEEADDGMPQRPMREQARCLRAFQTIARRGRARGLGFIAITQRSAVINKDVLTQIETLIVMRTTSPQDRKAIQGWVDYHGESNAIIDSLPTLETGEAWIWSPHWLGVRERVQIRPRRTFDSGATPQESTGKARRPSTMADIDLDGLQKRFASAVERAKADDPKELRKRIAELEGELRKAQKAAPAPTVERVEVPVLQPDEHAAIESIEKQLAEAHTAFQSATAALEKSQEGFARIATAVSARVRTGPLLPSPRPAPTRPASPPHRSRTASPDSSPAPGGAPHTNGQMKGGKFRELMIALAQRGQPMTARQLATRAGMAQSGTFDTYIGRMRKAGWIDGSRQDLVITATGTEALGHWEPLPVGEDLRRYWLDKMGGGKQRALLEVLIDAYPQMLSAEELADRAEMALSGTFDTYIGRLRRLELIDGPRSALKASDELFLED